MRRRGLIPLLAGFVASGALADSPRPAPLPKPLAPIAAYGAAHPACLEWNDGCQTCRRADGRPACSLPGIACIRRAEECTTTAR